MQDKDMIKSLMDSAVDLIQTYNSGLSKKAIIVKTKRIAEDLMHVARTAESDLKGEWTKNVSNEKQNGYRSKRITQATTRRAKL